MSIAFLANPREFHFRNGSFRPNGRLTIVGSGKDIDVRENPVRWGPNKTTLAARVVVGLSIGDKPTYQVQNVVDIVKRIRGAQGKQGASFITQKGMYQHTGGKVIVEDAVQIIIIDVWKTPRSKFETEAIQLAEVLATNLKQEEVIVEIQKNGVTQKTMGIGA